MKMKYYLIKSKINHLSKMVYAETDYHALSMVRHLFEGHSFKDFIILTL
jgi:hypothetical protein